VYLAVAVTILEICAIYIGVQAVLGVKDGIQAARRDLKNR
jgi:hypothetical protein